MVICTDTITAPVRTAARVCECDLLVSVPFDGVIKEGMVGSKCEFYCPNSPKLTALEFALMADAIADLSKKSGKPPLFYSLCQWGRVSLSK